MTYETIATHKTREGIIKLVAMHWYSPNAAYYLKRNAIMRTSNDSIVENHRVVKRGDLYHFQRV